MNIRIAPGTEGKDNVMQFKKMVEDICHKRDMSITEPIRFEFNDWERLNIRLRDMFSQDDLLIMPFDSIENISEIFTRRINTVNSKIKEKELFKL